MPQLQISKRVLCFYEDFVKVSEQILTLEKYSGKASYRIGLDIKEELITSSVIQVY